MGRERAVESDTLNVGLVGSYTGAPGLRRSLHARRFSRLAANLHWLRALESTEAGVKFSRDIRDAIVNRSFMMTGCDRVTPRGLCVVLSRINWFILSDSKHERINE
jgi:hypothetical protein